MGIFDRKPNVEKMLKKRDVEGLMQALEHGDQTVRLNAAFSLAHIGYAKAEEPFIRTLRGADFSVADPEAGALLKGLKHADTFVKLLKDIEPNTRWGAALALVCIGNTAVEPLIEALRDQDWSVRGLATVILGKIGTPAVEPLIKALNDEERNVRWGAAIALGDIGDARAVEPLTNALKDEDSSVRRVAKEALKKIKDTSSAKIVCPQCGSEVGPGKKFCTKCGAKLSG
jgi:HEAT repeat protein